MIEISPHLAIHEDEVIERFVRASGPGGQKVNKTSSAVELRFDVRGSPNLPEPVKARMERLAGRRLTLEGVLVIQAERFRTQELNRADALQRLVELIAEAAHRPKPRRPTKPTYSSKLKRLEGKAKRSGVKAARGRPSME